jgi:hypothetical protein
VALVQTANDWNVAIARQTNESTISTTPAVSFPVFSGRPQPVQEVDRVNVTDASAIQGDPYKKPNEHWEADLVVPGNDRVVGEFVNTLYVTDTFTVDTPTAGVGRHVMSGLGSGSTAWFAMYSQQSFAGSLKETFEAGQGAGVSFSATEDGGPARLGFKFVGKRPTAATTINAATSATDLTNGYYTATGGTLQYEADNSTPVTETNIRNFTLNIDRAVTPEPTADSVSVSLLSLGKVEPALQMELLWTKWDEYRASYYGAVAGTAPSSTLVAGSWKVTLPHSSNANLSLVLTVDKVVLVADPPQPNPDGGPLIVPINGYIMKPASGDHVKVTVFNLKNTTY